MVTDHTAASLGLCHSALPGVEAASVCVAVAGPGVADTKPAHDSHCWVQAPPPQMPEELVACPEGLWNTCPQGGISTSMADQRPASQKAPEPARPWQGRVRTAASLPYKTHRGRTARCWTPWRSRAQGHPCMAADTRHAPEPCTDWTPGNLQSGPGCRGHLQRRPVVRLRLRTLRARQSLPHLPRTSRAHRFLGVCLLWARISDNGWQLHGRLRPCMQRARAHGAGRQDESCPPGCAQARCAASPRTRRQVSIEASRPPRE